MTNKSKFSVAALFSAAVLGGAFFATNSTVNAATTDTPYTAHGNAYVSFSDNTTGPVDPSDPTKPGNSDNSTTDNDPLALLAIPSTLNFGDNKLEAGDMAIKLVPSTYDGTTYSTTNQAKKDAARTDGTPTTDANDKDGDRAIATQVKNFDANVQDWSLSAKLNDFTNGAGAGLPGATITLKNGQQQNITGATGSEVWNTKDTIADLTLSQGTAQTYLTATDKGVTQQIWKDSDVQLNVPAGVATQSGYTATIDWTLSATAIPASTTNP